MRSQLGQGKLREVVIACPGSGKTRYLTDRVIEVINTKDVLFLTYTRAAAEEARSRVAEACPQLSSTELEKSIRTLNSWAHEFVGAKSSNLATKDDYNQVLLRFGYPKLEGRNRVFIPGSGYNQAATITKTLLRAYDQWRFRGGIMEEDEKKDFTPVREFFYAWNRYKKENNKIDYFDQLKLAKEKMEGGYIPSVDVLLVDEAQDYGHYHWSLIDLLVTGAKEYRVAGDDDQCIYSFSGANPKRFIDYGKEITFRQKYLTDSYRVPQNIIDIAIPLLDNIEYRYEKEIKTKSNIAGDVIRTEEANLHNYLVYEGRVRYKGDWLVLARTRKKIYEIKERYQGLFDRFKIPVRFLTIHQAKGLEATNVVLFTYLSRKVVANVEVENESRLFYVALTRSKKRIIIVRGNKAEFAI